jgi:hypothetical protein
MYVRNRAVCKQEIEVLETVRAAHAVDTALVLAADRSGLLGGIRSLFGLVFSNNAHQPFLGG